MSIAFTLRESYAGTVEQTIDGQTVEVPYFTGGLITAGEDEIDVRAALDEGDGFIVVPDDAVAAIVALDQYPPLKRTTVPDGDVTLDTGTPERRYEDAKVEALRGDPRLEDVVGTASARKSDLIVALVELDRRQAEGDSAPALEQPITIAMLVEQAHSRGTVAPEDGNEEG